jgi:hypothetical protein
MSIVPLSSSPSFDCGLTGLRAPAGRSPGRPGADLLLGAPAPCPLNQETADQQGLHGDERKRPEDVPAILGPERRRPVDDGASIRQASFGNLPALQFGAVEYPPGIDIGSRRHRLRVIE